MRRAGIALGIVLVAALAGCSGETAPTGELATATARASASAKPTVDPAAEAEASARAQAEKEAAEAAAAATAAAEAAAAQAAAEAEAAAAAARGTVSQQNAYSKALDYLDYTAFSRSGLVDQLVFEGFPAADAEFAIARLESEGGVDWNAQAAQKAADYLDYTSFSRAGLIDQLVFEGFTADQAAYGVSTTGL